MIFRTAAGCAWNSRRSSAAMDAFGALADERNACGSAPESFVFGEGVALADFVFVVETLAGASAESGSGFGVVFGRGFFFGTDVSVSSETGFLRTFVSATADESDTNTIAMMYDLALMLGVATFADHRPKAKRRVG